MSFMQVITENQRLVILRALNQDGGFEHNESVLQSILRSFGHSCSRDQVRSEIQWLQEQGLVTCREVAGYQICRLTQRGADVATGCSSVPGVQRPGPGRGC